MDQFNELEKYKALLDDGTISEEEFRKLKQKLLGLKTDEEKEAERQQERAEALAEIEKMRAEKQKAAGSTEEQKPQEASQSVEKQEEAGEGASGQPDTEQLPEEGEKSLRSEQDRLEELRQEHYAKTFTEEKAKEKARLEALEEQKRRQRAEQKEMVVKSTKAATSVVVTIILWIVTVFCLLLTLGSFMGVADGRFGVAGAVVMLVFTILACPFITKKTRDIPQLAVFYKFKKFIVVLLIIIYLIISAIEGGKMQDAMVSQWGTFL